MPPRGKLVCFVLLLALLFALSVRSFRLVCSALNSALTFDEIMYDAERTIEREFDVGQRPRVIVNAYWTNIRVIATERETVQAKVTVRAFENSTAAAEARLRRDISVEMVSQQMIDGPTVQVDVCGPNVSLVDKHVIELQVPAHAILALHTHGKIHIALSDSELVLDDNVWNMEADLGKRHVHLTNDVEIDLKDCVGTVDIRDQNALLVSVPQGIVTVSARPPSGVQAIHFTGTLTPGHHSFETTAGDILLTLPAESQFFIDAETTNGQVLSDFLIPLPTRPSENRLLGEVGSDPLARIRARTGKGTISIQKVSIPSGR
jgi:hypothetical protein